MAWPARRGSHRGRRRLFAAVAAALALCLAALAARPLLARAIRARIIAEAARRGLVARVEAVHVGLWPPLRLEGVALEMTGSWRLGAGTVEAWWPGRTRLFVRHAVLRGPAGLTVAAESTAWDVAGLARDDFRAMLVQPRSGVVLTRTGGLHDSVWSIEAADVPVGRLLDVRRLDRPLLDGGTMDGSLTLGTSAAVVRFDLDLAARHARLPALAGDGSEQKTLGEPTAVGLHVVGSWRRPAGVVDIPRWSATIEGASLSGSFALRDLGTDPSVDLSLDVERLDFARLLRTSGLQAPGSFGSASASGRGEDLGSAALVARARGRLSDPASFVVTQRLDFTPPPRLPAAIERLRGGFVHEVGHGSGAGRMIDVSPSSADFIPLVEVPPLFQRALLLGEDAGFYTHPGIDLREVPAALLTDWERGGAARGASTITQQLAKNLFLSHEKRLGRKLQELSLTLLLESALGKDRILEIYLNIIEWGPDLYGLRPAARAYFGREPRELTPAQVAFLVSLIPAPVKYQRSLAHGTPGPGLRRLVDALLAKLRSEDALTEDEYRRALDEEIVVQGREAGPARVPGTAPSGAGPGAGGRDRAANPGPGRHGITNNEVASGPPRRDTSQLNMPITLISGTLERARRLAPVAVAGLGLLSLASAEAPVCRPGSAPRAAEARPVSGPAAVAARDPDTRAAGDTTRETAIHGDRRGNVTGWLQRRGGGRPEAMPTGARTIDAQDGRLFVEIPVSSVAELDSLGLAFEPVVDADLLNVGAETFDIRDGEPAIPPGWSAVTGSAGRRPYVVKFDAPIREPWLADLREAGAEVVQYQPHFGYLLIVPAGFEERIRAHAHVAFRGEYHPAYKARAELKARAAVDQGITVRIVMFDLPGWQERIDGLLKGGARLEATSAGTSTSQWTSLRDFVLAGVRSRDLPAILRDPAVYWAEEWAPPRTEDERASQIIAGNHALGIPAPGYHAWLAAIGADGSGVTVAVADTGFDTGVAATIHPDLRNRTAFATAICANSRDRDGHGTNTASIAVGDPRPPTGTGLTDGSGFFWGTGGAPGAHLWVQKALNDGDCTTSFAGQPNILAADAFSVGGARIGNHSFTDGATPGNGYTANCAAWDARTRDADPGVAGNQPYLVVFSAGNSGPAPGTLTSPHGAKNILTVGNTENYRPGQCPGVTGCGGPADDIDMLDDSSSRGPTVDNRIKPDLAAPGHTIAGARSSVATYGCFCDGGGGNGCCASTGVDGANLYTAFTGTSQSAPRVAGAAAVVFDWFRDRFGAFPSPAMAKAILINGAVDMKTPDIPNFNEGWGRLDLSNSLTNPGAGVFVDQTTILGVTGDAAAFTVNGVIQDPTRPVTATLDWTDPAGAVNCDPCLVNDLDLLVTQGPTTWRGNNFTAGFSNTAATADTLNNVEGVRLQPGTPTCAPIQFKVRAQALNGDGVPGNADTTDQDFALVASNIAPAGVPFVDIASAVLSGGCDDDGFLDRRETATLTVGIRNRGCAAADGVAATLSVLSGPSGAAVTVAPSGAEAIGTIAPGAMVPHDWQVSLADNAASLCAGKVVLQLAINDAAARTWTRTIEVTLDADSLSPATDTDPATIDRSSSKSAEWSLQACRTTSSPTSWHMGQADCSGIVRDTSSQDLVFTYNLPAGALLGTLGFRHAFGGYRNPDFTLTDSVQVDIDAENDGSFVNLDTWRQGIDNPTAMTPAGPYDLTPFNATRGPSVAIRFRFQSAANWIGGPNTAAGWDVDDIILAYSTVNCDTGSCATCAGIPAPPEVGDTVLVTRDGGNLTLTWDAVPGATRYNVYVGTIGTWWSHAIFTAAGLDGADSCFEPSNSVTFAAPAGDLYFLVAADNVCRESSLGPSTPSTPRPYATPSCSPH